MNFGDRQKILVNYLSFHLTSHKIENPPQHMWLGVKHIGAMLSLYQTK